jgi:hypothetical protein
MLKRTNGTICEKLSVNILWLFDCVIEVHKKLYLVTLSAFVLVIIITMEIRPKPAPDALSTTRPTDTTHPEGVEYAT